MYREDYDNKALKMVTGFFLRAEMKKLQAFQFGRIIQKDIWIFLEGFNLELL